ncbi:MAG: hypothetical protein WC971_07660 [Coriobacteriia bacterium]
MAGIRLRSVRFACACVLGLSVAILAPAAAIAAPTQSPNQVPSGELIEHPKRYAGKDLDFTGEAIGEVMFRGDWAWIHLNDDAYYERNVEEGAQLGGYNTGMAVWIPGSEARKITFFGDYKHEGDIVTVRGVFNPACALHGGDMDIHATTLVVDRVGHAAADPVKPWKAALALVLACLAALAWWADRTLRVPGFERPARRGA